MRTKRAAKYIACRLVPPADPVAAKQAIKELIQTWAALAADILLDENESPLMEGAVTVLELANDQAAA